MGFFDEVLPTSKGYVPLILKDVRGALTDTQWFLWPDHKDDMIEYVNDHSGEDVYFSPMLYSDPRTLTDARHVTRDNVIACRVVYADADEAHPEVFDVAPTFSVETSEGRWHLYWVMTDATSTDVIEQLNHSVYNKHKSDGVDSGWALSKRLRVPSTLNTKEGRSWVVTATRTGDPLSVAEFAADYPPVDRAVTTGVKRPKPDMPEDAFSVLNRVPSDARIMGLVMNAPVGDRSKALYELEMRLFEAGLSAEETYSVALTSACNKFKQDGRGDGELWAHVLRAESDFLEKMANTSDTPPEFLSDPETVSAYDQTWDELQLLDDDELARHKRTFIERFADWGVSRSPKSARAYHEAAAWTILSVVFSEFGHLIPSFGRTPLNLYFLTLGRTTQSRKSTTKNFMLDVLRGIETDEYNYVLSSDVTAEALSEALSKREDRSSLVWKDEVQSMFDNATSKGGYLRGLLPFLTNTYDGRVEGMLRRTGGTKQTRSVSTYLVYYGMGIIDQTAKALTEEDFFSGFLPRVLFAIDHGGESGREFGAHDVTQNETATDLMADPRFGEFCMNLIDARKHWAKLKNKAGATLPIKATEPAWRRWQDFTARIEQLAFDHPTRADLLSPGAQRLGMSVLKCSALLAMYRKSDQITMDDMLVAIRYGNQWAKYMEEMTRHVSKTAQARDIDELEAFVSSNVKGVNYSSALAKFKGRKSVREFNELLEYCVATGTLYIDTEGRTKKIRSMTV